MSTREIADRVGISQSTYVDWENDKSTPTLKLYFKLSNAFALSPIDLMHYLTTGSIETTSKTGPTIETLTSSEIIELLAFYRNEKSKR